MCCGTRMTRLAAGVPASFVKERSARTWLMGGFGSGDCSRVRPSLASSLPCPEAATLASHRVRLSSCRVRPKDPVRLGGCRRRRYVSRSPLILHGSTLYSMLAFAPTAATREDERYLGRPACTTPTLRSLKYQSGSWTSVET